MSLPQEIVDEQVRRSRSIALAPRKARRRPQSAPSTTEAVKAALDGVDEVTVASVVTVDDLAREPRPRPEHYKVICISLYNEDLARLDELVRELKKRGFTKANRSAVLRAAVEQFDPERVQRGL